MTRIDWIFSVPQQTRKILEILDKTCPRPMQNNVRPVPDNSDFKFKFVIFDGSGSGRVRDLKILRL